MASLRSLLALIVLSIPLVISSLFILVKAALRVLGWQLLRTSDARRAQLLSTIPNCTVTAREALIFGFFHPFCHAGGGGERVLWTAIRATQARYPTAVCAVYTGDHDVDRQSMLDRVKTRFNIPLDPSRILFVYISHRSLVAPELYPHFTLLMQSLGSIPLVWSAFKHLVPDVFIDTMGYPFTYPFTKHLFGSKVPVGAYVHYPTISTDMLSALPASDTSFRMRVKKTYWQAFAGLYSSCGSSVDVAMANSSWTAKHIRDLWPAHKEKTQVLFPPCSVAEIEAATDPLAPRKPHILSIAQFRPEKRLDLIIRAFALFRERLQESDPLKEDARLILLGSVRDDADSKRVYELRLLAHELGVKDKVDFVLNSPWSVVLTHLASSALGVNAMWNEHFGIGVVEYLAAGLGAVVHNSGGPKEDIVGWDGGGEGTIGWCVDGLEGFAEGFRKGLGMVGSKGEGEWRVGIRKRAMRFGESTFEKGWVDGVEALVDNVRVRRRYF
ncbi:hypothetical protein BDZ91DRAFT_712225 [Kalaharituber pfeilii]|nr:hypothetical protein BDZ91DRAFT_712225 [Kalaharituber pfeilii]